MDGSRAGLRVFGVDGSRAGLRVFGVDGSRAGLRVFGLDEPQHLHRSYRRDLSGPAGRVTFGLTDLG